MSDVAKHFRGIRWFNRCVGCGRGRNAKRNAKPLAMGVLPARFPSRTANWIAAARKRLPHCSQTPVRREGIISLWPRPWKTGPALCLISNLYQAWLSLPVCFEPSIHFTRPIVTMSEQWGMNGAACLVCRPVRIQQQPGRRDMLEVRDQPVHQRRAT